MVLVRGFEVEPRAQW